MMNRLTYVKKNALCTLGAMTLILFILVLPASAQNVDEFCGDSIIQLNLNEICDSNFSSCTTSDGYPGERMCAVTCSSFETCESTLFCGDGICTEDAENHFSCTADCPTSCGNGITETNEQCDDGNLTNDDGCNQSCEVENFAVFVKTAKEKYAYKQNVNLTSMNKSTKKNKKYRKYSNKNILLNRINARLDRLRKERVSRIHNPTSFPIKGYLTMKVLRHKGTKLEEVKTVVNESFERVIEPQSSLDLSSIWEDSGGFMAEDSGDFIVYAGLRDSNGDIVETNLGSLDNTTSFEVFFDPWEISVPNGTPTDIVSDLSQIVYILGFDHLSSEGPRLRLLKSHGSGNLLLDRTHNLYSDNNVSRAALDSDFNIIVAGYKRLGSPDPKVVKLANDDGKILLEFPIPNADLNELFTVEVDSSDNIYVLGNNQNTWGFAKTDPIGNLMYTSPLENGTMIDMITTSADEKYFFGHVNDGTTTNWQLAKYDTNFDKIFEIIFPSDKNLFAKAMTLDDQGNIFLVGFSEATGNKSWFLAKVDSNGEIIWKCELSSDSPNDIAYDIEYHATGYIHVIGDFANEWVLKLFSAENGIASGDYRFGPDEGRVLNLNTISNMLYMAGIGPNNEIRIIGQGIPEGIPDPDGVSKIEPDPPEPPDDPVLCFKNGKWKKCKKDKKERKWRKYKRHKHKFNIHEIRSFMELTAPERVEQYKKSKKRHKKFIKKRSRFKRR